MTKLAPSLLSADFLHLQNSLDLAEKAGADYLHYDVMDGAFVPNISFGAGILSHVTKYSKIPVDAHLMVDRPERYIEDFAKAGAHIITVHAEATNHLQRALSQIHACGCLAGVALNPATSPECLRYIMGDFDLVLAMTVNPGFGGQKLIPAVLGKIQTICTMLQESGSDAMVEVDGGVGLSTYQALKAAGANVLVAGSAFFGAADPVEFSSILKS